MNPLLQEVRYNRLLWLLAATSLRKRVKAALVVAVGLLCLDGLAGFTDHGDELLEAAWREHPKVVRRVRVGLRKGAVTCWADGRSGY